jgi:hypothetical protein
MAITGPRQGPPPTEAAKEYISCEVVVGLRHSNSDAIIDELFRKRGAGCVAWKEALDFQEAK